jgi:hypothetical protein
LPGTGNTGWCVNDDAFNRNFQLSEEEEGLPACQGLREIFVISNSSDSRNWISPEGHLFSYKVGVSLKGTG